MDWNADHTTKEPKLEKDKLSGSPHLFTMPDPKDANRDRLTLEMVVKARYNIIVTDKSTLRVRAKTGYA